MRLAFRAQTRVIALGISLLALAAAASESSGYRVRRSLDGVTADTHVAPRHVRQSLEGKWRAKPKIDPRLVHASLDTTRKVAVGSGVAHPRWIRHTLDDTPDAVRKLDLANDGASSDATLASAPAKRKHRQALSEGEAPTPRRLRQDLGESGPLAVRPVAAESTLVSRRVRASLD